MKLRIGDLLVRYGKILRVHEIKSDIVMLKPFFEVRANNGLVYSIQNKNLDAGKIRKLVTKDRLKELWNSIFNVDSLPQQIDVVESKSSLNLDGLDESLVLIKTLWTEKQAHAGYLPGGRLSLFQQALSQATDEIAAVKSILPEEARTLVLSALKKRSRVPSPSPASA
jgi:RNA polymerase-interacting CarD/CdnL/TRCF family regulator